MSLNLQQYIDWVKSWNLKAETIFYDYKKKVEDSIQNKENIYLRLENNLELNF